MDAKSKYRGTERSWSQLSVSSYWTSGIGHLKPSATYRALLGLLSSVVLGSPQNEIPTIALLLSLAFSTGLYGKCITVRYQNHKVQSSL